MSPRGARDATEPEVRSALEQAGFETFQLEDKDRAGVLDTLAIGPMPCPFCSERYEQIVLIEVKTLTGRLRPEQAAMLARHPRVCFVARSGLEALAGVGANARPIRREARRVAQASTEKYGRRL